jgi:glucokinase
MENDALAVVLDIGGSHVTSALIDIYTLSICPSSLHRIQLNPDAPATILLETWVKALQKHMQPRVIRIGIAMPNPFEYDTGISRLEHKFAALYGLNIGKELQQRLKTTIPIYFGNDASLFALGEWWAGAAQGHQRMIGVTLGTGLGGGFVADGCILYSGEGVPPDGGIWNLPYLDGIAEDYVSGPSLVKNYTRKTSQTITPLEIAQAARTGDLAAQESYHELGTHLGAILQPWAKTFKASCIVVGGNIARSWDLFASHFDSSLASPNVRLVASTLYDHANLLGAAALGGGIRD